MTAPQRSAADLRRLVAVAASVAVVYFVAARLGFRVAFVAEQVTTVWAPTGIAIAVLVLWGRRLWPAVWLAAFAANAASEAPLWTAGAIATGNTLEAVFASWALRRARVDPRLQRLAHAIRFIVIAVLAAPAISATLGVVTLAVAGVQAWPRFAGLWAAWWMGDALGALIVAPVILTSVRTMRDRQHSRWKAAAVLVASAVVTTEVVFGQLLGPAFSRNPLHYVIFPFVIIAAVRFGQPATALVVLGTSMVTIWHTVQGVGPFAAANLFEGLVPLQLFMGVLAGTGLLLAATMIERQTSQRRRGAAHSVSEVLAGAPDLAHAAPALLRSVCQQLEWQCGALWLVDEELPQLRCFAVWCEAPEPMAEFVTSTRGRLFQAGIGLPGRVWQTERANWIEDVLKDANFPRAAAARAAGLHGAFGFPIRLEGETLGMVEFLTHRVAMPDPELLDTMSTVGNQIGQFIGRKRVEAAVLEEQRRSRDADRRKDEFLAMLAHELRNPLAPIRTGLQLAKIAGDDSQGFERIRLMMERQVGHMVRLVDDLLDVSRITSGKIQVQRRPASLTDLLASAIEANRGDIQTAQVHLEVNVSSEQPLVLVDPTRMVQVLSNLLNNAVKFTPAGGRISISGGVTGAARTRELGVTVRDTGIGISPEMLPRVFDLFTQAEQTAGSPQGGLGIGLALARRIVELHDGRIEARSGGISEGSEFTVRIPVPDVEVSPDADPPPATEVLERRVLVVDDNEDAAEMLAALIRALGGEARTAVDGAQGIAAASVFAPDVVMLDIGMPGMDGYEVCRRLRREPFGRDAFIVALTGWGQEQDKQRAAAAGFDAHVTKPADPSVLERLLRSAAGPDRSRRSVTQG